MYDSPQQTMRELVKACCQYVGMSRRLHSSSWPLQGLDLGRWPRNAVLSQFFAICPLPILNLWEMVWKKIPYLCSIQLLYYCTSTSIGLDILEGVVPMSFQLNLKISPDLNEIWHSVQRGLTVRSLRAHPHSHTTKVYLEAPPNGFAGIRDVRHFGRDACLHRLEHGFRVQCCGTHIVPEVTNGCFGHVEELQSAGPCPYVFAPGDDREDTC